MNWCPVRPEALDCDAETMDALREMLFSYLGEAAHEAWRTIVEQRGLRGAALINFLCFHLDITPLEKQTLLEALADRVDCLLDVLTFKLEERKHGPAGTSGGPTPFSSVNVRDRRSRTYGTRATQCGRFCGQIVARVANESACAQAEQFRKMRNEFAKSWLILVDFPASEQPDLGFMTA